MSKHQSYTTIPTGAAEPAPFTLEDRLNRVGRADLAAVSLDDVARLKATVTPAELAIAMRVMLESNRFSDVLASSSSDAWSAAARDVSPLQMGLIGALVREKAALLYGVLPYVSADFLEVMRSAFASHSNGNSDGTA